MSNSNTSSPILGQIHGQDDYKNYNRGRSIKSCQECRRRKMRCSRSQPCHNCSRFSRECRYFSSPGRRTSPLTYQKGDDSEGYSDQKACDDCWPSTEHLRSELEEQPSSPQPMFRTEDLPVVEYKSYDSPGNLGVHKLQPGTQLQLGRLRLNRCIGGLNSSQLAGKVSLKPFISFAIQCSTP